MKTFKIYLGKHPLIDSSKPIFMGEYEADSFERACQLWYESKKNQMTNPALDLYSIEDNTWWGSKLYQSEADAMVEFKGPDSKVKIFVNGELISAVRRAENSSIYYDELGNKVLEIIEPQNINQLRNNWQPISTAPDDDTKILAWDGRSMHVVRKNEQADKFEYAYWILQDNDDIAIQDCIEGESSYAGMDPTHWMPLPEPPK